MLITAACAKQAFRRAESAIFSCRQSLLDRVKAPPLWYAPGISAQGCKFGLEEAMYSASDLRKGLKVEIEGVPYVITEFNFVKPGKGQALYNCRLKNMITGLTITKTYRSVDKFDEPRLEQKTLSYSYPEGDHFVFMDEHYEQITISGEVLGDSRHFLVEDISVDVLYHNNRPIEVTLPTFVEKEIVHTEPGARGDTATNVLKSAKIEGGYEIQVPLFVNQGDIVRIDTRTGKYADRVAKR
jgi:elongation factor P